MKKKFFVLIGTILLLCQSQSADACTGITLTSKDNSYIVARTIEWGGSKLNSQCVIVPRGYVMRSFIPGGSPSGMEYTAHYGFAGLSVEQEEFVAEGINEAGLSAGLFYFPAYGQYESYRSEARNSTLADLQLVSYLLATCATVEEAKIAIGQVHVVGIDSRASTVHWRIADKRGRQLVLEFIGGEAHFYENRLGVLTNAPGFDWQLTNLNNYVNLLPGSVKSQMLGERKLTPFGSGSGFLGMPGDITPPSRFVRAAFYQYTAPQQVDARATVLQCFHLLNNFDIPIGIEFSPEEQPADIPSATQWTAVTDLTHGVIYYRTMYNSAIRSIDLSKIDWNTIRYQVRPLDAELEERIEEIVIR